VKRECAEKKKKKKKKRHLSEVWREWALLIGKVGRTSD
jgi:hypothetical protein